MPRATNEVPAFTRKPRFRNEEQPRQFPRIARYEGTLGQHLKNAILLAAAKLPRILIMVAVHALPFVLLRFPLVLSKAMIFLAVFGFGLSAYLDARLIVPAFRTLEGETGRKTRQRRRNKDRFCKNGIFHSVSGKFTIVYSCRAFCC